MRSVARLAVLLALVGLGGAWAVPVSAQADAATTDGLSIYWLDQTTYAVARANVDGSGVNASFVTTNDLPYGMAVDAQHIYWSDQSQPIIGRSNLDGSDVQNFISLPPQGAVGLAADSHYVYWTSQETGSGTIGRASLDGKNADNSFITGPIVPMRVAVDGQHIYWTDQAGTIGRANLDGTDVKTNFITGASGPVGLAIDALHVYWVNVTAQGQSIGRANLDGTDVNQNFIADAGAHCPIGDFIGCGWGLAVDGQYIYWLDNTPGTIGRANVDGSEVNQSFITGLPYTNDLTLSAPTQPVCMQAASPPPPPIGGATFARALEQGSSNANTVVLPAGSSWKAADVCAGAADVMTHPTSISVAPGGGVALHDDADGLVSAWGGRDIGASDPAPDLYPGRSDWQTTQADLLTAQQLLDSYAGCPACDLPANTQFTPGQPQPEIAYQYDVSDASFEGDTLTGGFDGWNFSGTDLRGAHLVGLQSDLPSSFSNITVGLYNGVCTRFENSDLVNANLKLAQATPGCEKSPLLQHSSVPLGWVAVVRGDPDLAPNVNLTNAIFVADASDRSSLKGQDLHGIDLSGTTFLGWPVDLSGTTLDGANLSGANLALADLSGATLHDVNAAGASFRGAHLAGDDTVPAANFAGSKTNLEGADFIQADISGASFASADLSAGSAGKPAQFDHVLARGTDFTGVNANQASFNGAHIYGNGQAFQQATDLSNVDFTNALLAGDSKVSGGFDFTSALLKGAHFDGAQCIACTFASATLNQATFVGAYLPGVIFSSAVLQGVSLNNAWLYCGDTSNSECPAAPGASPEVTPVPSPGLPAARPSPSMIATATASAPHATATNYWSWQLALGSNEVYGPVRFGATDLTGVSLADIAVCPDGDTPASTNNCAGQSILPSSGTMTQPPIPCPADNARGAVALDDCPTQTSPLGDFSTSSDVKPLAVVAASPPAWATRLDAGGSYVGMDDATVRLVGATTSQIVSGQATQHCATPTEPCGDDGPAADAQLGTPAGLAVGLDGAWYIADPDLHRVRKVDASHNIRTVAGSGQACAASADECGDGGLATDAALSGPTGVWVDPVGNLWIADGVRGIRHVLPNGTISSLDLGSGPYDIQSVVGDATGHLYATTTKPDYLLQVDLASGQVTQAVGTGTSGYNGTCCDAFGDNLPGNQVQVAQPTGLSLRLDGDVLFADTGNNLVRAYVPSQGTVIDLGGVVVNGTTPQGGYNGEDNWADQTELNHPAALSATAESRYLIVVADTDNHLVRQLGPAPVDESAVPAAGSPTPSPTPTVTPTASVTPAISETPTATPSATPDTTPVATLTETATALPTTPTQTATALATPTETAVRPTDTPSPSPVRTATPDATATSPIETPRPTPRPSATAEPAT
ncbi:MAG: pentapeptide repeat-containing protein [Chloroflexi bacterium]|nr:pentapeptide repeat-containing protein [Chloroflexota bacterium]